MIISQRVPETGEIFELTIDFDSIDPLEMFPGIRQRHVSDRWQYIGAKFSGIARRRFILVRLGFQDNLEVVRNLLSQHGMAPVGQWRESFRTAFPRTDRKGLIGFADPSWTGYRDREFPVLVDDSLFGREEWSCAFFSAISSYNETWRWVVDVTDRA